MREGTDSSRVGNADGLAVVQYSELQQDDCGTSRSNLRQGQVYQDAGNWRTAGEELRRVQDKIIQVNTKTVRKNAY